jgi:hypothetical protein
VAIVVPDVENFGKMRVYARNCKVQDLVNFDYVPAKISSRFILICNTSRDKIIEVWKQ